MSIVPSGMSSRFSFVSSDSRRQSADSSEIIYQELSIDDELFTAQVYKRNYRNNVMQYKSRCRQPAISVEADEIRDQVSSELPSILGRGVWAANVDYLTLTRGSAEVTIEGPPADRLLLAYSSLQRSSNLVSGLPYPSVCRFVEICDLTTISGVLRSTTERFHEWKQCVLYEACKQRNRDMVKALLDHGVWKDGYCPTGNASRLRETTPMHVAAYSPSVEIVETLIKKAHIVDPIHREDDNGYQPLHIACRKGPVVIVALLIDHGANPKAQTAQGDTPLHLACMNNNIEKVELFLAPDEVLTTNKAARNTLLEMKNQMGWTPLHVACRYGSLRLIRKLLLAGSPASSKTFQDLTPLHVACTRGVLSVVDELLRWHDFPGEEDDWYGSPLVVAVSGFNFPVVTRLLDASYNPNFSCKVTGKTILQQALSQPCFDAISVENRRNTIKTLLAFGANAGMSDLRGNTALHHWAIVNSFSTYHHPAKYTVSLEESWYLSLLHLLMNHGAFIGIRNHNGETPIDLAARSHDVQKIKALQLLGGKLTTLES